MIRLLTIIGARPQIIKAAALSRIIKQKFSDIISEKILHTGQHYDENMSQIFINELKIPSPDYNLTTGSGTHGEQTAKMIAGIEKVLLSEKPDAIVLFGDTNSTLAGAVAASKLFIPVIHIEAGLRSYNKTMPEEINRLLCDHVSTVLCCPTQQALFNLYREGFQKNNSKPYTSDNPLVVKTGDLMLDNSLYFSQLSDKKSSIIKDLNITKNNFFLSTLHRPNNTDDAERLNTIFESFISIAEKFKIPLIIPLHPRTKQKMLELLPSKTKKILNSHTLIKQIPPVSFFDMINLEKNCKLILTDSGGVQKEAFFFKKPCIILRSETEWVEIVESGAAIIANADKNKIFDGVNTFLNDMPDDFPNFYGEGNAAFEICNVICNIFKNNALA